MKFPFLKFSAEDSRIYEATTAGIYEVARVECPENKSYYIQYINQWILFDVGYGPSWWLSSLPFGKNKVFWDLRMDRNTINSARPPILIGAATGIQGNPVSGWPRRDHAVCESMQGYGEYTIEVRGPCILRLFCDIPAPKPTGDWFERFYIGGRLVVCSE